MQHLRELVRFLPQLESPAFEAGEFIVPPQNEMGVLAMPYVKYSEAAEKFVRAGYEHGWVLRGFNWPEWAESAEAKALRDDETALARATPEQITRLLTVLIRQDRFVEGALLQAFSSGLILRIVRRAAAILSCEEEQSST
jgi:hypothetical protein